MTEEELLAVLLEEGIVTLPEVLPLDANDETSN